MGPIPITGALPRRAKFRSRGVQGARPPEDEEAGMMLAASTRGRGRSLGGLSLRAPRRNQTCAHTLILDFWLLELGGNEFLFFKLPSLWNFVTAATENSYTPSLIPTPGNCLRDSSETGPKSYRGASGRSNYTTGNPDAGARSARLAL